MEIKYEFDYTGKEQLFTVPYTGKYKLEAWGASGGGLYEDFHGGYGGYATGDIELTKGDKLYIYCGGNGIGENISREILGGYNGGGIAMANSIMVGSGGGATHISVQNKLLTELDNSIDDIIIVSGGGAGLYISETTDIHVNGNSGGGYHGGYLYSSLNAGTQTTGYDFGQANPDIDLSIGSYSGGGGGFYGGFSISGEGASGGGSGYIGNSKLISPYMVGYNVPTSEDTRIKTLTTNNFSENAISDYAKLGNGYVRITYYAVEKFLIRHNNNIYTILNKELTKIEVSELTSNIFLEYGTDSLPDMKLLINLYDPEILHWHDVDNVGSMYLVMDAVPQKQTVTVNDIYLTDSTVTGVDKIILDYEGNPLFNCSFDDGITWKMYNGTEWIDTNKNDIGMTADVFISISTEEWSNVLAGLQKFSIQFILSTINDKVKNITVNYLN